MNDITGQSVTYCGLCRGAPSPNPVGHTHIVGPYLVAKLSREQRVRDLIAKWQPRLRLQAWDIRYVDEPLPDVEATDYALACSYVMGNNLQAQVWIDPDAPDADLEALVLHELGHMVAKRVASLAEDMAASIGGKGGRALELQLHNALEILIDSYAIAITGRNPLFGKTVKQNHLTAWGYVPKPKKQKRKDVV